MSETDFVPSRGNLRRCHSDQGSVRAMVSTPFPTTKRFSAEAKVQKGAVNVEEIPLTEHHDLKGGRDPTWTPWKNTKGRTRSTKRDSYKKIHGFHPTSINRKLDKAKGSLDAVMDKILLSPSSKIGQSKSYSNVFNVSSSDFDELDCDILSTDDEENDDDEVILSTLPSTLLTRPSCPTLMAEKSLRPPSMKDVTRTSNPALVGTSLRPPSMRDMCSISEELYLTDDDTTTDTEKESSEGDLTSSPSVSAKDAAEEDKQNGEIETQEKNNGLISLQAFFADTEDVSEDEKEHQSTVGPCQKSIATAAATAPAPTKVSFKKVNDAVRADKMLQVRSNDPMELKEFVAGDKRDNENKTNKRNLNTLEELIQEDSGMEGKNEVLTLSPTLVPSRKLQSPRATSVNINTEKPLIREEDIDDDKEVLKSTPPTTPTPSPNPTLSTPMQSLKSKLRRSKSGDCARSDRRSLTTFRPPMKRISKEILAKIPRPNLTSDNSIPAELLIGEESSDDDMELSEFTPATPTPTPASNSTISTPMKSLKRTIRRSLSGDCPRPERRSLATFRPPIRRKSRDSSWRKGAMFKNNKMVDESTRNKDNLTRLETLIRDNDISLDTLEELIKEKKIRENAKDNVALSPKPVPAKKLSCPRMTGININPKELLNRAEESSEHDDDDEVNEVDAATNEVDIGKDNTGNEFPSMSATYTNSEEEGLEEEESEGLSWLEFRVDDTHGCSHVKRESIN